MYNERLKELRIESNMTQSELANKLGVTPATISKYEKGQIVVAADIIIKYSKVFNVTPDYILGSTNDKHEIVEDVELSDDDIALIELFHKLSYENKIEVKGYIKGLLSNQ